MSTHRTIKVLAAIGILIAGGLWFANHRNPSGLIDPSGPGEAQAMPSPVPASQAETVGHRSAAPRPTPGSAPESNGKVDPARLSQYQCRLDPRPCKRDTFLASSDAEAAWLASFGYPTPDEEQQLASLPKDELEKRADAGDLVAEVFLARAMMRDGERFPALGRAADALVKGSVYASYALSEFHGPTSPRPNRIEEGAYLRLAYLQGDWKAAMRLAMMESDPNERVLIDQRAISLYSNLLDEKGRFGYRFTVGTRPGSP